MTGVDERGRLRTLFPAAILVAVAAGFAWGFFAHRDHVFPYSLVQEENGPELPGRIEIDHLAREMDPLRGIPYVGSVPVAGNERSGMIHRDPGAEATGLRLWCSWFGDRARLIDVDGAELHTWSRPSDVWAQCEALPDGGLLVLRKDRGLLRLDRDSRTVWELTTRAHHWFHRLPDGRIAVLTRERRDRRDLHPRRPVEADVVVMLDRQGRPVGRTDLLEAVLSSPWAALVPSVYDREFPEERDAPEPAAIDLLHANYVEVMDGSLEPRGRLYAKGNLVVCLRTMNAVAVVEPAGGEVLWLWGPGHLRRPHHPALLENGNVLVLSNGFDRSEALEVEPTTRRIVWRYRGDAGFFTQSRGGVQRLPNGNTLVSLSDRGVAVEVDPAGQEVWRFVNPDLDESGMRHSFHVLRWYPEGLLPFSR